jgi:hypothetical protein
MLVKEVKQLVITIRSAEKRTIEEALKIISIRAPNMDVLNIERIDMMEDRADYHVNVLELRKDF